LQNSGAQQIRLLFVDDEPSIRYTLPAILRMHDFEVEVAATVGEAMTAIQREKFDVLLTDLNIGEPGDGFTLVSAMRRIQPLASTFIITGYPAFETALNAIRAQVDDFFVKPAAPEDLVLKIRQRLQRQPRHSPPVLRKISFILEEKKEQIIQRYVDEIRSFDQFPVENLSEQQIRNHLPDVLSEIIIALHGRADMLGDSINEAALSHGAVRCQQGFTLLLLVEEMRILRGIIFAVIQENLLLVDVSSLIPDMIQIGHSLDIRLKLAIQSYLKQCAPDMAQAS
jgi:YesN/AraC family two-component response regulator